MAAKKSRCSRKRGLAAREVVAGQIFSPEATRHDAVRDARLQRRIRHEAHCRQVAAQVDRSFYNRTIHTNLTKWKIENRIPNCPWTLSKTCGVDWMFKFDSCKTF